MKRKRLFIFIPAILIVCISFGFFYSLGDDPKTSAVQTNNSSTLTPPSTITQKDLVGAWQDGANVLQGRYAGRGVTWKDASGTSWLYFIGGDMDGSGNGITRVDKYSINGNAWTNVASMPNTLANLSATRLKDSIYTVGGLINTYFTSETNIVQKYDINANSWTTRATLPITTGWPESVGYQDSLIYCLGGMITGSTTGTNAVWLYNCYTNTWRAATNLPVNRLGGACAVVGDTIVYAGGQDGWSGIPDANVYRGVISQSNRSTIAWTTGLSYPGSNRWRFTAASWGCKGMITTGGAVSSFTIGAPECYVYSPGANTWTQQANITHPMNTGNAGSVLYSSASNIYKFVVASGLILTTPYSIPQTQIFTDTLPCGPTPAPFPPYCLCDSTGYTPITCTAGPSGDDVTITVPIGFNFSFMGKTYTQASICTNGFVVLGATTYSNYSNDLCGTTAGENPMLAPFWDDLYTPSGGNIQYTTLGSAPNRIFVTQYTDVAYLVGTGGVTMQVKLYETANRIEFIYGPAVANPTSSGSVGETDTIGGVSHVYSFTPGSTCPGTTVSQTVCNNAVVWSAATFPVGRRYTFNCPTGIVPTSNGIPREYKLAQNYPNPFNPSTKISFALPKAGNVELKIYDILGREVTTLVNEFRIAGNYTVDFNASNLASGVYFYRIKSGDFIDTKKMVLMK
jgi:hypothetical protein